MIHLREMVQIVKKDEDAYPPPPAEERVPNPEFAPLEVEGLLKEEDITADIVEVAKVRKLRTPP
jgi:hypothetical protein